MRFAFALFLVALSASAFGQDPPPQPIPAVVPTPVQVFPLIPTPDKPPVVVVPADPDAVPVLLPGRLLVIQSPVKFSLVRSDNKLASVRKVKGPRDITGVFIDGPEDDIDRTYDAPFIAIVKAEKGQSGRLKLTYIPKGAEDESEFQELLIDIGVAPRPPPDPVDPVDPVDPPEDDPLTKRVKAALSGNPTDAARFGAVCAELAKAMEAGEIVKQSDFEAKMIRGLDAVGWPKNKYADLTKLSSELFDRGEADWILTAEDKVAFAKNLRALATACEGVK